MGKICGVYSITNNVNGKMYIGSSCDIRSRWNQHLRSLKTNKHHSKKLQSDWNLYKESDFCFEIIETCSFDERIPFKQKYIDYYKTYENGYNSNPKANATLITEEMKQKISQSLKGKFVGENCFYNKYSETMIKNIIKDLLENKLTYTEIAQKYNVGKTFISNIVHHREWTYLTNDIVFPKSPKSIRLLTEKDVRKIIDLLLKGKRNNEIAKQYNVAPHTISDIRLHKTWEILTKGIDFPKANKARYGKDNNKTKLSVNEVKEIKKSLLIGNVNYTALGKKYKVSCSTIINIRDGITHANINI